MTELSPSTTTAPSDRPSRPLQVLAALLIVCSLLAFEPVTRWLITETVERGQIRQAGMLLLAAAGLVGWQHRRALQLVLDVDNRAMLLLGSSYVAIGVAWITGWSWLLLPGSALALAGSLRVLVGPRSYVFLRPLVTGFATLLAIVLLFPSLDWPLRGLAGTSSAALMEQVGQETKLGLLRLPEPKLILNVEGRNFEVAPECNGFGLITTSLLLALLVAGVSRQRWWVAALLAVAAAALGFALNTLRIFAICLLAPKFPGHYYAMHETVGTLALWIGMGLVTWFAWRRPPAPRAGPAAAA